MSIPEHIERKYIRLFEAHLPCATCASAITKAGMCPVGRGIQVAMLNDMEEDALPKMPVRIKRAYAKRKTKK